MALLTLAWACHLAARCVAGSAVSQTGDARLQRQSQGTVRPEAFTHGSSAQRVSWFKRGLAVGRMADCNTFEARTL